MDTNKFLDRVDELIELANSTLSTKYNSEYGGVYVSSEHLNRFKSGSLSFIKQIYGANHPYYEQFTSQVKSHYSECVEDGRGILQAIKNEFESGWLQTTKGLISAEIFADFLEMAEHLLEKNYKDPAAVMAGSVLEEHLRQLCEKHGIPVNKEKDGKSIPNKADLLNADLSKKNVYNKLEQKQITAWLDLRNKAAHSKYGEYTKEQVKLMLQGISDFLTRVQV